MSLEVLEVSAHAIDAGLMRANPAMALGTAFDLVRVQPERLINREVRPAAVPRLQFACVIFHVQNMAFWPIHSKARFQTDPRSPLDLPCILC